MLRERFQLAVYHRQFTTHFFAVVCASIFGCQEGFVRISLFHDFNFFSQKSKTFSVSFSHAWYSAAERPRRLGLNYLSLSAMASFSSLVWACVFAVHCCSSRNVNALPPPAQGVPLTSIAFGSCNKEWMDTDANLWVSVIKSAPNVWVWLGDAICESCYVDCIFRFHAWRCLHLHTPLCAAGEKESDH